MNLDGTTIDERSATFSEKENGQLKSRLKNGAMVPGKTFLGASFLT